MTELNSSIAAHKPDDWFTTGYQKQSYDEVAVRFSSRKKDHNPNRSARFPSTDNSQQLLGWKG